MTGIEERFDRNIRFFGAEGQKKLRNSRILLVGVGGVGSHVLQQLSLLGVGEISVVDDEDLSTSNKNRYVCAQWTDTVPGTRKVDIAKRLSHAIDPSINFHSIYGSFLGTDAFEQLKKCDYVFGCLDDDGPRFVLNDLATAYGKPYIDLSSDIIGKNFGGRIVINWNGDGCLYCFGELDLASVRFFLEDPGTRSNREAIYGIQKSALDKAGPSVVSINGVIASLAVTEFMLGCTGLRMPTKFINYDGMQSRAVPRLQVPESDCPYCSHWGIGEKSVPSKYLQEQLNSTDD
jgi:ThiF family